MIPGDPASQTPPPAPTGRFAQMPAALVERSRSVRLAEHATPGGVPALLAHPDWERPAPVVLWMHGRTVSKEIDPGRYLRWIRAGVAACAVDLPGHGERHDPELQSPLRTLDVVARMLREVDHVVADLMARHGELFDTARLGIGGMSAGGMVALRRLCEPHAFACAAVESTAGSFDRMPMYDGRYDRATIERLDPMRHIEGWRPIPLLALHSEADEWVPVGAMRAFADALRERHRALGADPDDVRLVTWPTTGAPAEHAGFGRVANDAKNLQTAFFARRLGAVAP